MPSWCDPCIRKSPAAWTKSVAFRDGVKLCQAHLDELVPPPPRKETWFPGKRDEEPRPAAIAKEDPVPEEPLNVAHPCDCNPKCTAVASAGRKYARGHYPRVGREIDSAAPPAAAEPAPREIDGPLTTALGMLRNKRRETANALAKLDAAIAALEVL